MKIPQHYIPYTTSTCNVCYKSKSRCTNPLKLCSNCKLASYCSVDHQKQEWKSHKPICQEIYKLNKKFQLNHCFEVLGQSIDSYEKLDEIKLLLKNYLKEKLRRNLHPNEMALIDHPKICKICFNYNHKILIPCDDCNSVFYCSKKHKYNDEQNHIKFCKLYRFYYKFYLDSIHTVPSIINRNTIQTIDTFPSNIFKLFENHTGVLYNNIPQSVTEYPVFSSICNYTFVTTILYALHTIKYLTRLNDCFTIDVVGVEHEDAAFTTDFNWLFGLFLKNVKKLTLNLIGPEIKTKNMQVQEFSNQTICINKFQNLYQDCVKLECPDFIISFNCGFYEYNINSSQNTWKYGIKEFIKFSNGKSKIPVCFTSFTKRESEKDFESFKKSLQHFYAEIYLDLILSVAKNPFYDRRPLRNTEASDPDEIYFVNNYINLIIPKLNKEK